MPTAIPISAPSLYDGAVLEGRLLIPDNSRARHVRAGVILAHPYAPLGGCFGDPIILLLARQLLMQGFIVVTFNFRGAGRSEGKTSWSSAPEQKDFETFAGLLIFYILRFPSWQSLRPEEQENGQDIVKIVYGGYSYGSMIAGQTPPAAEIFERFANSRKGSVEAELVDRAKSIPLHSSLQEFSSVDSTTSLNMETLYLLTSPLLPPVSAFLSLSVKSLSWNPNDQYHVLTQHRTLVVAGGRDCFSSRKKLQAWAEKMKQLCGSRFDFEEIEEAGHFWREAGVSSKLQQRVVIWTRDVALQ